MKSTLIADKLPSNRKFGYFFAVVFFALATYIFLNGSVFWSLFFIILALAFGLVAVINPHILKPLNLLWFRLGMLLGSIVSPIVLGLLFFLLITPISCLCRILKRDTLRLKKRSEKTYWVDRCPPGPAADSFKNQF